MKIYPASIPHRQSDLSENYRGLLPVDHQVQPGLTSPWAIPARMDRPDACRNRGLRDKYLREIESAEYNDE
ncbi:MAG: hypothetical protein CL912_09125 [Deltaproteobacteria bacterium]|nr:hypothetical protein [Deltaproteobacteria bacterium]